MTTNLFQFIISTFFFINKISRDVYFLYFNLLLVKHISILEKVKNIISSITFILIWKNQSFYTYFIGKSCFNHFINS